MLAKEEASKAVSFVFTDDGNCVVGYACGKINIFNTDNSETLFSFESMTACPIVALYWVKG